MTKLPNTDITGEYLTIPLSESTIAYFSSIATRRQIPLEPLLARVLTSIADGDFDIENLND